MLRGSVVDDDEAGDVFGRIVLFVSVWLLGRLSNPAKYLGNRMASIAARERIKAWLNVASNAG